MMTMTTYAARPYAGEADLAALLALQQLCSDVDNLDEHQTRDDWLRWLQGPDTDPARDLRIWEDAAGRQVAHASLWVPAQHSSGVFDGGFDFRIHPDVRGDHELEGEIVAWAEESFRHLGREHGLPVQVYGFGMEWQAYNRGVLAAHGFTVTRYFFIMRRPFSTPIPEPQFPAGYTLRYLENDAEVERWVEMFNQSFIDHWNFHPVTVERRQHRMSSPAYRREGDLIAVAPDGTFAGFCACAIDDNENRETGRNEGWIGVLGTRRGYRGIGLGRALLLAGMQYLHGQGLSSAVLGVDAENPTGALGLYERTGFVKEKTEVSYCKDL